MHRVSEGHQSLEILDRLIDDFNRDNPSAIINEQYKTTPSINDS